MGLIDWFSALARGDEGAAEAARSTPQAGAIKEDSVIQGLDFVAAVEAHRKWKERLTAYVQGTSTEKLDYTAIRRDDQCNLGKWIYSSGIAAMGNSPVFHQLKSKHAHFHVTASRIVELVQHEDKPSAQKLLSGAEYTKASDRGSDADCQAVRAGEGQVIPAAAIHGAANSETPGRTCAAGDHRDQTLRFDRPLEGCAGGAEST